MGAANIIGPCQKRRFHSCFTIICDTLRPCPCLIVVAELEAREEREFIKICSESDSRVRDLRNL